MTYTKEQIDQMPYNVLHYEVAKILGDIPYERSYEGFMEHYAHDLDYTSDWSLVGEIVDIYVSKLFRNVGGTWTVVMKDIVDDGTMSGQPVFTSFTDQNPLKAMVKCLIMYTHEIRIQKDN